MSYLLELCTVWRRRAEKNNNPIPPNVTLQNKTVLFKKKGMLYHCVCKTKWAHMMHGLTSKMK